MVTSAVTGICKYQRKSYTLKLKRSTIHAIPAIVANQQASNIAFSCRHLKVDHCLLYRWKCLLEGEGNTQGEMSGSTSDSGKQQTALTHQLLVLCQWPHWKMFYMGISGFCIRAGWVCFHLTSLNCCDFSLNSKSKEFSWPQGWLESLQKWLCPIFKGDSPGYKKQSRPKFPLPHLFNPLFWHSCGTNE